MRVGMLVENMQQLEYLDMMYEWADMVIDTALDTEPEVKAGCMMGIH